MDRHASTQWNLRAPPGFRGFREDSPLTMYEQLLPHWRQSGATYFATFRLADSLPQSRLRELRAIKAEWERTHPPPRSKQEMDQISRALFLRIEMWLDQGFGRCLLLQPQHAECVIHEMHACDNVHYELGCYVIMPNHVHAILRPLDATQCDVENILGSWKGRSAYKIHWNCGEAGRLWQRESYDRLIRDEEHLWRVIQYVGRNPVSAKLNPGTTPLWIRPSWVDCGWNFQLDS